MKNTDRYHRQIILKEIGEAGQQKLLDARVLVIGAGGLGCPALQYLAAAGVGTIGIVDFDLVDISNLHRQVLYTVADVGLSKAQTAASKLNALNPDVQFDVYNLELTNQNALQIIADYDLIIDGTDNFATRYLVNDACVLLNKPLVYGAVLRFEGQVGVFNFTDKESSIKTNYRDLFPKPPDAQSVLSCDEAGVLGVLPGTIGTMQATEAFKIITGIGVPLCNQIVSYNVLSNAFYKFSILPTVAHSKLFPKTETEFLNFNYDWFCGIANQANEITVEHFDEILANENPTILDVREINELPVVNEFTFINIPINELAAYNAVINDKNPIVVFCKTGNRSAKAIEILRAKIPGCNALSLAGGIIAWKKQHKIING